MTRFIIPALLALLATTACGAPGAQEFTFDPEEPGAAAEPADGGAGAPSPASTDAPVQADGGAPAPTAH